MSGPPGKLDTATVAALDGCPARIFPLQKPEGHNPPITRYSAVLPREKVAVLFLGIQSADAGLLGASIFADLVTSGDGDLAPAYADFAGFTDPQGYRNRVAALYWLKPDNFAAWLQLPAVAEWRTRVTASSSIGLWWEPVVVRADYMETIAFKEFLRGVSGCPAMEFSTTDRSGYWGAARDRIPAAAHDLFEATTKAVEPQDENSAIRHYVIKPPENMAVIRSGVSWAACEGEQLKDYQERIRPALDAGMDYLRNNPRDTGCYALRQVTSVDSDGEAVAEGYSLGAFVSLAHLESWAKVHPSHLAIYTRALAARRKYQEKLQLRTYNEIFIIGADNPPFEYFNCHPGTGLLPYVGILEHAAK